jgi:hypothetical protein
VRRDKPADAEPEAVQVTLSEVVADSRLNWVLQAGTRLDGGAEPRFEVPWAVWQERASAPVDAWLPEVDGEGVERALAALEHRYRLAQRAQEEAAAARARMVAVAGRVGFSRRDIARTIGVSAARIQQLHREAVADHGEELDAILDDARVLTLMFGHDGTPTPPDEVVAPRGMGVDRCEEVLAWMVEHGLLERVGEGLVLTVGGRMLSNNVGERLTPRAGDGRERRARR